MAAVNLGCGQHPAEGWVNVDSWPGVKPDVVASLLDLPFPDGSADRVYCGHVLEHLEPDTELQVALEEIRRVLHPNGRLCVVGPDVIRAASDPEWSILIPVIISGGDRYPGDRHKWTATGPITVSLMRRVFPTVREVDIFGLAGWPVVTPTGWQSAVLA